MRVKITLACTECKQRNYNMTKEKKNHPEKTVGKQTVAVVGITVVLGVIISVLDSAVLEFVNLLIK